MKTSSEFKKKSLQNADIKKEYDSLELEFSLARQIIKKRIEQNMTQTELAKKIGTKQSAISRIESGRYNPSLSFLQSISKALNSELKIQL